MTLTRHRLAAFVFLMLALSDYGVRAEARPGQAGPERQQAIAPATNQAQQQPRQERKTSWRDSYGKSAGTMAANENGSWRASREDGRRRSFGEVIAKRWPLLLLAVVVVVGLLYAKRLGSGVPPKPPGGSKLATDEEVLAAYNVPWGQGGFLLGRVVPPDLTPGQVLMRALTRAALAITLSRRPGDKDVRDGEDPRVVRMDFESRTKHNITEAGSGRGKTTTMVVPQLLEDAFSGVCNNFLVDRKSPDMFYMVAGAWEAAGRRAILFDPWAQGLTWGFEPLWGASMTTIRAMVEAHVQISWDPADTTKFYREQEKALLEALFVCAQEWGKKDRKLATLPAVAELVALGFETTRLAIEQARPDINRRLVDQWKQSDADLGKIFRSIYSRLKVYLIPEVKAAFSRRDFTIDDVVTPFSRGNDGGLRTILIVGAHQANGEASELLASFMTQMVMHAVYERSVAMKLAGATWRETVPLAVTLDEIGTYQIGRIGDFQAVARDAGVALSLQLQERSQIDEKNGRDASKRMMRNSAHRIFMGGLEVDTAKELSIEIGDDWVLTEGRTKMRGSTTRGMLNFGRMSNASTQARWMEHPIRTPDEIINMKDGRALVFGPKVEPFEIELVPYYKSPRLLGHVTRSKEWVLTRRERNLRCDGERVPRPAGEVPRLEPFDINWAQVVGEEVIRTGVVPRQRRDKPGGGSGEGQVDDQGFMTRDQEKRVRAKGRDLRIDLDRLTMRMFGKRLKDSATMGQGEQQTLTKGEGQRLLSYLEEQEQQARRDKELIAAESAAVN